MERTIKQSITKQVDHLLNEYQRTHRGENPLYIILSPNESKALADEIRINKNYPDDFIITTYRDSKIVEDMSVKDGESYASNDLPGTGS